MKGVILFVLQKRMRWFREAKRDFFHWRETQERSGSEEVVDKGTEAEGRKLTYL